MLSKCINVLLLKLVMFRMLIIILINTYIETACLVLWNLLHIHLNLSTKETISEFRWVTTHVVLHLYNVRIVTSCLNSYRLVPLVIKLNHKLLVYWFWTLDLYSLSLLYFLSLIWNGHLVWIAMINCYTTILLKVYENRSLKLVAPGKMVKLFSPSKAVSSHAVKNGGRHAETGRVCTVVSARPSVHYSVSIWENRRHLPH